MIAVFMNSEPHSILDYECYHTNDETSENSHEYISNPFQNLFLKLVQSYVTIKPKK